MRKIVILLICIVIVLGLAVSTGAATTVTGATVNASVNSDGSCLITAEMKLHLERAVEDLSFPIPASARGVTLNGSGVMTSRSGDTQLVKLDRLVGGVTGDVTFRLQYTIPNTVKYQEEEGKLMLTLPLLSGFVHPIDKIDFTVELPGINSNKPHFSSSYYQQGIEASMVFSFSGNKITGAVPLQLKDRETLSMTLEVTEEMFPQDPIRQWSMGTSDMVMIIFGVLALAYWIAFMRCAPFLRSRSTQAPEGYGAGELPCALIGQGMDLTMMVLTWAQLGYILIHVEDSGRVTLHKRMEMGNERSPAELRLYQKLFGKRRWVDGTGFHYASLCRAAAAGRGDVQDLFRRNNGNPRPFRLLCAIIGLLGNISIGYVLAGDALLGVLLIAFLALLGLVGSWCIQNWAKGLHSYDKTSLLIGFAVGAAWILLGSLAGMWAMAAVIVGVQLLAGLAWQYGGRRTPTGRRTVGQILGLRSYLKNMKGEETQRLMQQDPDSFFALVPYAIALGVGRPFARAFGRRRLRGCPYLTTGMDGHMTAWEWYQIMERAVQTMNSRKKRLLLERLTGR